MNPPAPRTRAPPAHRLNRPFEIVIDNHSHSRYGARYLTI